MASPDRRLLPVLVFSRVLGFGVVRIYIRFRTERGVRAIFVFEVARLYIRFRRGARRLLLLERLLFHL